MDLTTIVDQLLSDNLECKIISIRNLEKISKAIGPTKTQKELIPFLFELLDDQTEIVNIIRLYLFLRFWNCSKIYQI